MIKNSTFDVYERMDKKALETMALAFEADAAVAASIQGLEFIKARLGIVYALLKYKIHNDWLPTSDNINALPEPVRKFIHDIETNTDPAHIVRENILIKDTCTELVLKLERKLKVTEKWLVDFLREMPIYDAQPRKDYVLRKFREAGIKVVKK